MLRINIEICQSWLFERFCTTRWNGAWKIYDAYGNKFRFDLFAMFNILFDFWFRRGFFVRISTKTAWRPVQLKRKNTPQFSNYIFFSGFNLFILQCDASITHQFQQVGNARIYSSFNDENNFPTNGIGIPFDELGTCFMIDSHSTVTFHSCGCVWTVITTAMICPTEICKMCMWCICELIDENGDDDVSSEATTF